MVIPSVSASGLVPVFPLPDVVFFPGTALPLHIFELRYRDMVRDAAIGEGLIAMALLRPMWKQSLAANPPIYDVGTVGRIEDLEELPDGRFNIRLVGLQRAEFEEVASDTLYRVVRLTPRPERRIDEADPKICDAKLNLLASHGYLLREISGDYQPSIVLDERVSFQQAVNECCTNLPVDPELRQGLLECDEPLERQRRVSRMSQEVLEHVLRIKARGASDGSSLHLN